MPTQEEVPLWRRAFVIFKYVFPLFLIFLVWFLASDTTHEPGWWTAPALMTVAIIAIGLILLRYGPDNDL
jgi:heme/copper-type cytochrome/quinol oxidase subunit 4